MVAVAAPRAKGSVEAANFFHAISDGIARAGDEIASDDGKVSAEIVGYIHGAAHLCAGHITTEVNVADLHNLHAIESGRQIGQRNLDAADLIVEALCGETVHGTEERSGTRGSSRGAEEVAAGGGGQDVNRGRRGGAGRSPGRCFFPFGPAPPPPGAPPHKPAYRGQKHKAAR